MEDKSLLISNKDCIYIVDKFIEYLSNMNDEKFYKEAGQKKSISNELIEKGEIKPDHVYYYGARKFVFRKKVGLVGKNKNIDFILSLELHAENSTFDIDSRI